MSSGRRRGGCPPSGVAGRRTTGMTSSRRLASTCGVSVLPRASRDANDCLVRRVSERGCPDALPCPLNPAHRSALPASALPALALQPSRYLRPRDTLELLVQYLSSACLSNASVPSSCSTGRYSLAGTRLPHEQSSIGAFDSRTRRDASRRDASDRHKRNARAVRRTGAGRACRRRRRRRLKMSRA
jgi:hypothetical protein